MKRVSLFLLIVISTLNIFAANNQKQYKKLIEAYDVADEVKGIETNSPAEFWSVMLKNNEPYLKFAEDIKKGKGAEKEALEYTAQLPHLSHDNENIISRRQNFCDSLLSNTGIAGLNLNCSLYLINSNEINAYTALTDDGFAICLTTGLLNREGMTNDILTGYIANGFVHGALNHHTRVFYDFARQRRKNAIYGGFTVGFAGIPINVGAMLTKPAKLPSENDHDDSEDIIESTRTYCFDYTQAQIFEADLIAYRFLDNLGRGDDYIDGLRILGKEYDDLYADFDNRPTVESRIEFLEFVRYNPQLGNTKNAGLRIKRLQKARKNKK